MEEKYTADQKFQKVDFTENSFPGGEFENCEFINCNFSNTDLSNCRFSDCKFESCNLSMVNLARTSFDGTGFIMCKLVGVHFENCNKIPFSVEFINADLHLASFYQFKLPNTRFLNCSLKEVDFAEADLTNSVFENCDLSSAIFEQTILEKADLRTSYNFSIHPEINKIKKARFSLNSLQGLLYKYDIIVEG